MAFVIENDGTTVKEGDFDNTPLPDGTKVIATILPSGKDSPDIVIRPAAKQGANASKSAIHGRFRISDGQKGAGRNIFADIPLFRKWAPTGQGKYPDGTPAFLFFQFFRALGYDVDGPSFTVPEGKDLLGRSIELVLGIEKKEGFEPKNIVKFINKVDAQAVAALGSASSTTNTAPAAAGDIWGKSESAPVAQAPAQTADIWGKPAPQAFVPDAADVAYAADPATLQKTL